MRKKWHILSLLPITFVLSGYFFHQYTSESIILSYEVDLRRENLQFFWKDSLGKRYGSLGSLKKRLAEKGHKLLFAMNGGMYKPDGSPQGLYVEDFAELSKVDRRNKGYGNFYLQPNGVFYITQDQKGFILPTDKFKSNRNIKYATQSGPMLLIDGKFHPAFNKNSQNLNIRNGVGVLPNGNVLFAMSKQKINFYEFASFFKNKGCQNALYLDGFVSKTYLPSQNWKQLGGDFGVIIGIISPL